MRTALRSLPLARATTSTSTSTASRRTFSSGGAGGTGGSGGGGTSFKINLSKAVIVAGVLGFGTPFVLHYFKDDGKIGGKSGSKDGKTGESELESREDAALQSAVTARVFFDIKIDDGPTRRMVFGLYGTDCPKTVDNFVGLCNGDRGNSKSLPDVPLHYKNSKFHRIIPGFMVQGGDFTRGDGRGGESIYGQKFPDESFRLKHNGVGVLSMANSGPNTNGSQFFICLNPTPWLDGRHVVFGQLLYGSDLLFDIEKCGSSKGTPTKSVIVVDCGSLPKDALANEVNPNEVELDETGRPAARIFK
jgi:peptidylprolyl isomerase